MKVIDTPKKYKDSPPFKSFQSTKWPNIKVDTFIGLCPLCYVNTDNHRGGIVEHKKCIDISIGAICPSCNNIIFFRKRYYPDEGRWLVKEVNGWYEQYDKPQKYILFMSYIKKIKFYILQIFKKMLN